MANNDSGGRSALGEREMGDNCCVDLRQDCICRKWAVMS